jgi:hypothetical protein
MTRQAPTRVVFSFVFWLIVGSLAGPPTRADDPKPPLAPLVYQPLPLGAISPRGWLEAQLKTQAQGLSGHLDEFWPDIQKSAWFGGDAEGWERVPYWLDGVVPLAYVLDDATLKAKVVKAIDTILARQQPDGWLGPVGDSQKHKPYDVWPLFPLFKALTQYQEATGDARIVPALLKCAHKIDEVIAREPLYSWAQFRAADFAVSLYWLYDKSDRKEPWLLDLARKAFDQSHDWLEQYDPATYSLKDRVNGNYSLSDHGVNTGMALKYGPIRWRVSGRIEDRQGANRMLGLLDRYHGQATGIFTCDEHLAGRNPSQGTELCTVVEAMYALELGVAVTGDARLADRLERLACNALPATFKKDMTAHQYDQQTNQVVCSREGPHVYTDNGPDSNLYGLEPNFGCCTANLHQGWPKLVEHLVMKSADGGLAVVAYAPCVVKTEIQGTPITVEVKTDYPFRDDVELAVTVPEPMTFPIYMRQPEWVKQVVITSGGKTTTANAQAGGGFLRLAGPWTGTNPIEVHFTIEPELVAGYHDAISVVRGPLVFALEIKGEWKKVVDRENLTFDDWEVYPTSPWNYALKLDPADPSQGLTFENTPLTPGVSPFVKPSYPILAKVQGRKLAGWTIEKGAAQPPPESPVTSDQPLESIVLVPYGCTDLRITAFPRLKP